MAQPRHKYELQPIDLTYIKLSPIYIYNINVDNVHPYYFVVTSAHTYFYILGKKVYTLILGTPIITNFSLFSVFFYDDVIFFNLTALCLIRAVIDPQLDL